MPWTTVLCWTAITLLMAYVYFLGQILLHMCVHLTLAPRRWQNDLIGNVIASLHLTHFQGCRAVHLLHHIHTNTERDPHCIDRPLLPYMLTYYFRVVRAVWEPWRYLAAVMIPTLLAAGVVAWQASTGHLGRGLLWVSAFWLMPMILSHLLMAHFNYVTHVGLPSERGASTRNMHRGFWRLVNPLTFNFYLHAEHHDAPRHAIPKLRQPA